MKRFLSLIIVFVIIFAVVCCTCFSGNAAKDEISAKAFVLYCADNSEVLFSKNLNTPMPMASTTKIMTSLIALEYAQIEDKEVEFTEEMAAEGSSMYLKSGDVVKLSDLAAGMMTVSGNDAANAVAYSLSGSVEDFALLMNKRAKELSMKNTNFTNPSGLPDDNHYSTVYDMALLMTAAMENENFASLTQKKSVKVDFVNPQGHSVTYTNHNRLLSMYEYCTGGKTGYTKEAGRCLVTSAQKDGLRLVAVTFDAPNDWQDHIAVYNSGFDDYAAVLADDITSYSIDVMGAEKDSVTVVLDEETKCVVDASLKDKVRVQVYLPPFVYAPISKGDVLGKVVLTLEGKVLKESAIVSREDVQCEKVTAFRKLRHRLMR